MPELISDPNKIRLNEQQEIQQIMGEPPSWIIRWGNSLVLICLTILVLVAYLVKYPDTIPVDIILQTENPPIRVPAPKTGKIDQLPVSEGQFVEEGDILAVIESTADLESVQQLKVLLAEIEVTGVTEDLDLPTGLKLGSLQSNWSTFTEQFRDYLFFVNKDKTADKKAIINRKIKETKSLNRVLEQRQKSLIQEREYKANEVFRNRTLLKEGLISRKDLEQSETEYLSITRNIDGIKSDFINNEITLQSLKEQKLELSIDKDKNSNEKQIKLDEEVEKLKSEVAKWELESLIKAPISGNVAFSRSLTGNEFVDANEEMMTIVPRGAQTGEIIGLAKLPFAGAGKVRTGQKVNIQTNSYPAEEFGILQGKVKKIARIPQEKSYLVEVKMEEPLITTYGDTLEFQQQMSGFADIVTQERRYLYRLFDKLRNAFNNK